VITRLNLASEPFRNRNLPYILALLLLAISVAGSLFCFSTLRRNAELNAAARSEIEIAESEIKRLTGEGQKVQQELTPEQQQLLIAAHKLVANKQFGWSRLFADLESLMPGSVSASRISVENIHNDAGRIKAELEFSVLSRDHASVVNMIEAMNNSGLFQAELRGQDLQKSDSITYSEYSLWLVYSPAGVYSATETTDLAQVGPGGSEQ
jgi:Tfp pilus assembly protein PilN